MKRLLGIMVAVTWLPIAVYAQQVPREAVPVESQVFAEQHADDQPERYPQQLQVRYLFESHGAKTRRLSEASGLRVYADAGATPLLAFSRASELWDFLCAVQSGALQWPSKVHQSCIAFIQPDVSTARKAELPLKDGGMLYYDATQPEMRMTFR